MLGFRLSKESFVATATAIALVVDGARMPIYFITEYERIFALWPLVAVSTVAVAMGTFIGFILLHRITEHRFKRNVSIFVLGLGLFMLFRPNPG